MDKLYDEEQVREVPQTWEHEDGSKEDGIDLFYLRVRLFKTVAQGERNQASHFTDRWPVYFILEEYTSWEGEVVRYPSRRTKKRSYTTGPDSRRIRQCVNILDGFDGVRASGSR